MNKATILVQPWSCIHSAFALVYYPKCFRVPQSQNCVFGIPVLYNKDKTFVFCNIWGCVFESFKQTKNYITEQRVVY